MYKQLSNNFMNFSYLPFSIRLSNKVTIMNIHIKFYLVTMFFIAFTACLGGQCALADDLVSPEDYLPNKESRILTGHKRNVTSIAFSPDGKTLEIGRASCRERV